MRGYRRNQNISDVPRGPPKLHSLRMWVYMGQQGIQRTQIGSCIKRSSQFQYYVYASLVWGVVSFVAATLSIFVAPTLSKSKKRSKK